MTFKVKAKIFTVGCLTVFIAFFCFQEWFLNEPMRPPAPTMIDLSNHPIYSQYEFGEGTNIIDFGAQPLWVPTCLITETMRRDTILMKTMSELGLKIRFHFFLKGADGGNALLFYRARPRGNRLAR